MPSPTTNSTNPPTTTSTTPPPPLTTIPDQTAPVTPIGTGLDPGTGTEDVDGSEESDTGETGTTEHTHVTPQPTALTETPTTLPDATAQTAPVTPGPGLTYADLADPDPIATTSPAVSDSTPTDLTPAAVGQAEDTAPVVPVDEVNSRDVPVSPGTVVGVPEGDSLGGQPAPEPGPVEELWGPSRPVSEMLPDERYPRADSEATPAVVIATDPALDVGTGAEGSGPLEEHLHVGATTGTATGEITGGEITGDETATGGIELPTPNAYIVSTDPTTADTPFTLDPATVTIGADTPAPTGADGGAGAPDAGEVVSEGPVSTQGPEDETGAVEYPVPEGDGSDAVPVLDGTGHDTTSGTSTVLLDTPAQEVGPVDQPVGQGSVVTTTGDTTAWTDAVLSTAGPTTDVVDLLPSVGYDVGDAETDSRTPGPSVGEVPGAAGSSAPSPGGAEPIETGTTGQPIRGLLPPEEVLWPRYGDPDAPSVWLEPHDMATDLTGIDPIQLPVLRYLQSPEGSERLQNLWNTTAHVSDDAEWRDFVAVVADRLRYISLLTPHIPVEQSLLEFPDDPVAQHVVQNFGTGLTAPETRCVAWCDAEGNARVVPDFVIGSDFSISGPWTGTLRHVDDGTLDGATRLDSVHTHPAGLFEAAGLSSAAGDLGAAAEMREEMEFRAAGGSAAPPKVAENSVDLLTGTVTRGVPFAMEADGWESVAVYPSRPRIPTTDMVGMDAFGLWPLASGPIEHPLPEDIAFGSSHSLVRAGVENILLPMVLDAPRHLWNELGVRYFMARLGPVPDTAPPADGPNQVGPAPTGLDGEQEGGSAGASASGEVDPAGEVSAMAVPDGVAPLWVDGVAENGSTGGGVVVLDPPSGSSVGSRGSAPGESVSGSSVGGVSQYGGLPGPDNPYIQDLPWNRTSSPDATPPARDNPADGPTVRGPEFDPNSVHDLPDQSVTDDNRETFPGNRGDLEARVFVFPRAADPDAPRATDTGATRPQPSPALTGPQAPLPSVENGYQSPIRAWGPVTALPTTTASTTTSAAAPGTTVNPASGHEQDLPAGLSFGLTAPVLAPGTTTATLAPTGSPVRNVAPTVLQNRSLDTTIDAGTALIPTTTLPTTATATGSIPQLDTTINASSAVINPNGTGTLTTPTTSTEPEPEIQIFATGEPTWPQRIRQAAGAAAQWLAEAEANAGRRLNQTPVTVIPLDGIPVLGAIPGLGGQPTTFHVTNADGSKGVYRVDEQGNANLIPSTRRNSTRGNPPAQIPAATWKLRPPNTTPLIPGAAPTTVPVLAIP